MTKMSFFFGITVIIIIIILVKVSLRVFMCMI